MKREHLVSASVTNGAECICDPEILLGTNFGLWDFEKEQAPRGAILDLNAAWELFLSRKGLQDISFEENYHHQHEVIDGVVYEDGDTTYTLVDDKGNKTGATFTIKANKGPVEHIEWQNGNLILYYSKTRPVTQEDIDSGLPIHYAYDAQGQPIIDQTTGQPLIYDYVSIPIIEIFDNDETHKLFPWFADSDHTVRLRQNIDENNPEGHLGDFAVTSDSEIFFAKQRYTPNTGNTLISLQSIYDQLKVDLGLDHLYQNVPNITDEEGQSIHQRVSGSDINIKLQTKNKTSLVNAINEDKNRTEQNTNLISGSTIDPDANWETFLQFAEEIPNNINNLLAALNWIQHNEIGDFKNNISQETITEALLEIFRQAEENRNRIGYANNQWIPLTTKNNTNLTEAINEVDQHTDELAKIVDVRENWDPINNKTYYSNPNLNTIIKNRLRAAVVNKDDIKVIEAINDLQSQLGNLLNLTTDNKNSVIESINELDLHYDNNNSTIGATYALDINGNKSGDITNLQTDTKSTIVEAINELNTKIGDLDDLSTEDKTNLVNAVNEIISESPLVYMDVTNPDSGVILKNQNNSAGLKSLVIGNDNTSVNNSFISGSGNDASGNYSLISGKDNTSRKQYSTTLGELNTNDGNYNLVSGKNNSVTGNSNIVKGLDNEVTSSNSTVLGNTNVITNDSVTSIGDSNNISKKGIAIGDSNTISGDDSVTLGKQNRVGTSSTLIGINNEGIGSDNYTIGKNNSSTGDNNYIEGETNVIFGDDNHVNGKNNTLSGDNNTVIGNNQTIEANNVISIGKNNQTVREDGAVVINGINKVYSNSTHIGKDIYIQTHDTESKLQNLIAVDLNDWCKNNNAASLNGEKFLDTAHVVEALKVYLATEYTDNAILRFKMQTNNENGYILVQGKSKRVYLNGSWYYSDNIENGWSRHDGEYLKIIKKTITDQQGVTQDKYYLAFMDQLSTEQIVDTVGAQRSNSEDFGSIVLEHAYGAIDINDFNIALDLPNRFNKKVDKTAKIITKYQKENGAVVDREYNWVDNSNPNISGDITLDLKDSFGFDRSKYQLREEKGQPNGYVPLNFQRLIDPEYLPSYVDDVIDVWAEYTVLPSGALSDIKLYSLDEVIDPDTGQKTYGKGDLLLEGEKSKIYVEVDAAPNNISAQFRWTGSQFVQIGNSTILIGEIEGSAYDGAKGKHLANTIEDHLNSGTTQVSVEQPNGSVIWETYKPNPHNVKPEQLDITINDPNDSNNINLEDSFLVDYNVKTALQNLFDRINNSEDSYSNLLLVVGTQKELQEIENIPEYPTIAGNVLYNKERLDSLKEFTPVNVQNIVTNNFILDYE